VELTNIIKITTEIQGLFVTLPYPWKETPRYACSPHRTSKVMNWIILILAGLMEVGFTFCLGKTKTATGNDLVGWWIGFLVALTLSMFLMAKAAEKIPIGTVYPVWTGIGAVGAVLIGIIFFNEPATFWRMFFITTLICSIIGLKVLG
jgi:integral membrane protein